MAAGLWLEAAVYQVVAGSSLVRNTRDKPAYDSMYGRVVLLTESICQIPVPEIVLPIPAKLQ